MIDELNLKLSQLLSPEKIVNISVCNLNNIIDAFAASYLDIIEGEDPHKAYYSLLNITGLNISNYIKIKIIEQIVIKSKKIREIIFEIAFYELKDSLYKSIGLSDEVILYKLRECVLGNEFVENGYDNSKWSDFALLIEPYVSKIIGASNKEIVFWSKIDTRELNDRFVTIENSTLGGGLYFLDFVYANWNSCMCNIPKLEDFWIELSKVFTKIALNKYKEDGISSIDFYTSSDDDYFGEIFQYYEFPLIIESDVIKSICIHVNHSDGNKIIFSVDISELLIEYKNMVAQNMPFENVKYIIYTKFKDLVNESVKESKYEL